MYFHFMRFALWVLAAASCLAASCQATEKNAHHIRVRDSGPGKCSTDQFVSKKQCLACPDGYTRLAGDISTGKDTQCIATDSDCFVVTPTVTTLECRKFDGTGRCKVACDAVINCYMAGLACPEKTALNSTRTCTTGSAQPKTQCTTLLCCDKSVPIGPCVGKPTGTTCDDSNVLTYNDKCNASGACVGTAAKCTDGMQNGLETGVDCGGPTCPACPTCTDGLRNGYETGIDCGGPACPACASTTCGLAGVKCTSAPNTKLRSTLGCSVAAGTCTTASCCADVCTDFVDGTSCNDGNALTGADRCVAGKCTGITGVSCTNTTATGVIRCSTSYRLASTKVCYPGYNCNAARCCSIVSPGIIGSNPNSPLTCETLASNSQCLCVSGYYGAACTTATPTCTATAGALNVNSNVTGAATAAIDNDNVVIQLRMGIVQGRRYTAVRLNSCVPGNFNLSVQTTDATGCQDVWVLSVPVATLVSVCRLAVNQIGTIQEKYNGSVAIDYTDQITVGGIATQRSTTAVMPVTVTLGTSYAVGMEISPPQIVAPVAILAAVTAVAITTDSPTTDIAVTLAVPYPYQIATMNSILAANNTNGVTASFVNVATSNPYTSAQFALQACSSADYTSAAKSCVRTNTIRLTHNGACFLSGQLTIQNITFACGTQVSASDCPALTGKSGVVTLAVRSDNYCSNSSTSEHIDGPVSLVRFFSPDPAHLLRVDSGIVVRSTQRMGDTMYLRADFQGLPVFQVTLVNFATAYKAGQYAPVYSVLATDAYPTPPTSMFTGTATAGIPLGLDVARQSYLLAHPINAILLGSGNGAGPQRGTFASLRMQVVLSLSYDSAGGRRRRSTSTTMAQGAMGETLVSIDAAPPEPEESGSSNVAIIGAAAGAGVAVLIVCTALAAYVIRSRRTAKAKGKKTEDMLAVSTASPAMGAATHIQYTETEMAAKDAARKRAKEMWDKEGLKNGHAPAGLKVEVFVEGDGSYDDDEVSGTPTVYVDDDGDVVVIN